MRHALTVIRSLTLGLFLAIGNAQAQTTGQVCDAVRTGVDQLQSQLPFAIDYATEAVGISAIFVQGSCLITYRYVVDTMALLLEMRDVNDLSLSENLDFLVSDEGQIYMYETLYDQAHQLIPTEIENLSKFRGIKMVYQYVYDDGSVPAMSIVIMDTTGK